MKPGDIVRVKDEESFLAAFARKIKDRDAIVNWVGPTANGMNQGYASITFQKRNGRGKEFSQRMRISDLIVVDDTLPSSDAEQPAMKGNAE